MDEQNINPINQGEQSSEQPMQERVVSEKVVSEKVLGSSNSIARFGRQIKSTIGGRIGGVFIGLILILVSFYIVWKSESFDRSSAVVNTLPVLSAEQAAGSGGLIKVQDNVTSAPIKAPKEGKDVLYYQYIRQELEMVKRTETETQIIEKDGQDVEQTIEKEVESPEWVTKIDEKKWAPITLGGKITVNPEEANQVLDLANIYELSEEKVKENIEAVLPDGQLLVVGEIVNNKIEGGDPFIVSNKSNEKLIESLVSSEKFIWWLLKILTFVLFGGGLYLLLGPFLLILDAIPVLGKIGKGGLFIVCLLIGLLFTLLSSLLIHFWYLFLGLLILLFVYLIYLKKKFPKGQVK
ncbi:hypothetical protein JW977_01895 [Candidatus Falkowbacteria bacterium]|nr:hypothetical protein [Candidatus Falkowbacteria bacterium]